MISMQGLPGARAGGGGVGARRDGYSPTLPFPSPSPSFCLSHPEGSRQDFHVCVRARVCVCV